MSFTDLDVSSGGGDYIKLVAGTPITFHILSQNPEKSIVHWKDKKKKNCTGPDCDMCAEGDKPKHRWIIDVWDNKESKMKKFEFGSMIATQLKAIAEMMDENKQTIHDTDIRVKTTGSGLETEYSVLHVPMTSSIPQDVQDKYSTPF